MNGDPYRGASQPADRRVINRSGATTYRPADEPQPVKEEAPKTAPRSSQSRRQESYNDEKKSRKGLLWTIIIVVLVVLIGVAGWFVWSNAKSGATGIDTSKYQALFLSNGQVYFGKLESYNDEYFKLTTVYSAQAATAGTETDDEDTKAAGDVQLVRLGDEVYGPENEVFVSKQQILHYENLKNDSKVTQLIQQNEQSRR